MAEKFERCGGTEKAPEYMCPEEICDCMVLHKCKELHQLAINHKFDELKSNHKQCGFDDKNIPKYCCPISVWKKNHIICYEIHEMIKIQEENLFHVQLYEHFTLNKVIFLKVVYFFPKRYCGLWQNSAD